MPVCGRTTYRCLATLPAGGHRMEVPADREPPTRCHFCGAPVVAVEATRKEAVTALVAEAHARVLPGHRDFTADELRAELLRVHGEGWHDEEPHPDCPRCRIGEACRWSPTAPVM